jgi:hypothetical protein
MDMNAAKCAALQHKEVLPAPGHSVKQEIEK